MISHSQSFEDVLLMRALHHLHHDRDNGFWIDVGAYHPVIDSVTKEFSVCGWRGINCEPNEAMFELLKADRPRDINLRVAVTDHIGEAIFHEFGHGQLSTVEKRFAERHSVDGFQSKSYTVPATTLTRICEEHALKEIHFLSIDVEGHEASVLRGMDFRRFRPWLMIIEAVEPLRLDLPTHSEWEDLVLNSGYIFAASQLPNRFYVANEHRDLLQYFTVPADNYVRAHELRQIEALRVELEASRAKILDLESRV